MIITHKEFPDYRKFEIEYEGRPLKMEVGKMAELCNAAVLVTYGETTVLVTCTASARPIFPQNSLSNHRSCRDLNMITESRSLSTYCFSSWCSWESCTLVISPSNTES